MRAYAWAQEHPTLPHTHMSLRFLAPALLVALLGAPLGAHAAAVNTTAFVDIAPGDPDYDEVQLLKSKGIIQGITPSVFGPDLLVTRAELLKIALEGNAINAPELAAGQTLAFRDVTAAHTLANYVQFAAARGYVRGYGDGTFRPNQAVTFAEATKILLGVSGYTAYDPKPYFLADTGLGGFMNMAAQQDLFERSFDEHRAMVFKAAKRRDIARAMANVLRWRAWKDAPSTPLFACATVQSLTQAQVASYFAPGTNASADSTVCVAEQLRFGFAVVKASAANDNDRLVTFRTDTTEPILLTMALNGNACVIGDRNGLDIAIACDPEYRKSDGSTWKPGAFTFTFNFLTGAQWVSR